MDCSRPGSSVHGILQARIVDWVAIPSSSASSQPREDALEEGMATQSLLQRIFPTQGSKPCLYTVCMIVNDEWPVKWALGSSQLCS